MNLPEPWMVQPPAFAGCPKGLEYLAQLDRVLIHQQVEMLEAFTGWETKNKYAIKNGEAHFWVAPGLLVSP